jgi:hypothetical protein
MHIINAHVLVESTLAVFTLTFIVLYFLLLGTKPNQTHTPDDWMAEFTHTTIKNNRRRKFTFLDLMPKTVTGQICISLFVFAAIIWVLTQGMHMPTLPSFPSLPTN